MSDQWGVGDKADSPAFGTSRLGNSEIELIHGEHPHSRSDNSTYARTKDGTIYDFDGHRTLVDFEIKSNNYLKESGLSGDQIRKEVVGKIIANGQVVYECFSREPDSMLLTLHRKYAELIEHSSGYMRDPQSLIGRKIWYHDQKAEIVRVIPDQGAVIIKTGTDFKPPRYEDEDELDYWDDWREGDHYEVKDDVLSPHIWWWR